MGHTWLTSHITPSFAPSVTAKVTTEGRTGDGLSQTAASLKVSGWSIRHIHVAYGGSCLS